MYIAYVFTIITTTAIDATVCVVFSCTYNVFIIIVMFIINACFSLYMGDLGFGMNKFKTWMGHIPLL